MTRTYTCRRRGETAAATRRRILDAAAALYAERGVSDTTLQAVAERADVARGTIVHHFTGVDGLLEAVLDAAIESLEMPDDGELATIPLAADRIRWLTREMYAFFERSGNWYETFRSEFGRPAVAARAEWFWTEANRLTATALGDLAQDRLLAATVGGLVHPATLGALQENGLSVNEAAAMVGEALASMVADAEHAGPSVKATGPVRRG